MKRISSWHKNELSVLGIKRCVFTPSLVLEIGSGRFCPRLKATVPFIPIIILVLNWVGYNNPGPCTPIQIAIARGFAHSSASDIAWSREQYAGILARGFGHW